MSWEKKIVLRCDSEGAEVGLGFCPHDFHCSTGDIGTARFYAIKCGWSNENGNDYCPKCTKKMEEDND